VNTVDQIACQNEKRIAAKTGSRDRVVNTEDARTVSFVRTNNGSTEARRTSSAAGSVHRRSSTDARSLGSRNTLEEFGRVKVIS
jgi:hypothetical protein